MAMDLEYRGKVSLPLYRPRQYSGGMMRRERMLSYGRTFIPRIEEILNGRRSAADVELNGSMRRC
jgi:hypothetical protein